MPRESKGIKCRLERDDHCLATRITSLAFLMKKPLNEKRVNETWKNPQSKISHIF